MFKSIFTKLLVTYLLIIIAVISTLAFIITLLYNRNVFEEKRRSLESTAFKVNQLVNGMARGEVSKGELDIALDSMGFITDSKIYIIKLDRNFLDSSAALKAEAELEDKYLIDDLKKVIQGETVFRQRQYSNKFDMYMVFAGVPWKSDKDIEGAVLLFSPVNNVLSNVKKINLIICVIALLFIIISAIIIYINSIRISRPIKEMEQAALKLAVGENTEDLIVKSRDEIGRLAGTFNYMKQQLSNTEKMRKEFIANVSHDLRTPLTSISGFVEGMLDGIIKPENYNKYLLLIQQETNRLTRLTSEILQLAKLQSGNFQLIKEKINVLDMLECVKSSISLLLEEKNIHISISCDSSIYIYADKDKIKQVLINLISNSIKYSGTGTAISINAAQMHTGVQFSVKDTGIGIPAEDLPFVFEKFYQVDKSRQNSKNGTGLGLNIVKSLVELHGGKAWIISELGKGTEVFFQLPDE